MGDEGMVPGTKADGLQERYHHPWLCVTCLRFKEGDQHRWFESVTTTTEILETWQTITSKASIHRMFWIVLGYLLSFRIARCPWKVLCSRSCRQQWSNSLYSGSRAVSSSQWIPVPPWGATLVQELWRRRVPSGSSGNLQMFLLMGWTLKNLWSLGENSSEVNDKYWEMVLECYFLWDFSKLDTLW